MYAELHRKACRSRGRLCSSNQPIRQHSRTAGAAFVQKVDGQSGFVKPHAVRPQQLHLSNMGGRRATRPTYCR
eukprot:382231-Alexandrium_andersonii.AAC.1